MSIVQTQEAEPFFFTDSAVTKVKSLVEEEGDAELKLRIYVTGGGCSGFQYGFSFDQEKAEDDTEISKNGASFVIDAISYPYLVGSEVDYQEGLSGAKFVVNNPNATATCGCGASFSM